MWDGFLAYPHFVGYQVSPMRRGNHAKQLTRAKRGLFDNANVAICARKRSLTYVVFFPKGMGHITRETLA
jgi:hypothetical protein